MPNSSSTLKQQLNWQYYPHFLMCLKTTTSHLHNGLSKVINHKNGAAWTDAQTITHVKNAFRGDLIDWFNSLSALGIDNTNWDNVKTAFENDYRVKTSTTSMVQKIPEIKQAQDETVVQYFSKALKIMNDLKSEINPMELDIPEVMLPINQVGAFAALPQATKTAINTHMRNHVTTQVLNKVSALILTAGLRPEFRVEVLKQDNLTLPQIKELAIKHETLKQEKALKPKMTPKPNTEKPTTTTQINEIEEEEFTTVKNAKKKQTCKYCRKQGHSISNCWTLQSKNKARAKHRTQQHENDLHIPSRFCQR